MSLQTGILNFELITELPSLHLPSLFLAVKVFAAGVGHAPRPRPNHLVRPRFRSKPLALAPSRARHAPLHPLLATTSRMAGHALLDPCTLSMTRPAPSQLACVPISLSSPPSTRQTGSCPSCSQASSPLHPWRRRPRPPRRAPTPPVLDPSQAPNWLPHLPWNLPSPTAPSSPYRAAAAVKQGRRRPYLSVETPPPPSLGSNRPRERLHLAPTKLPSPATSAHGRRSAVNAGQTRRRPLLHAGEPRPAIPASPETTHRCASTPSSFSPTYPTPPASFLAGIRHPDVSPAPSPARDLFVITQIFPGA